MAEYLIEKSFNINTNLKEKSVSLCRMFGLTKNRLKTEQIIEPVKININDGDIIYITGASGSGKSVLFNELEKKFNTKDRINLSQIILPKDKTVINCFDGHIIDALKALSYAGLSDVMTLLNRPANLSEGQKYRFKLARALQSSKKYIFADEFCSSLDRITACVIAYHVRKIAIQEKLSFILASSHNDILQDLQPDLIVIKEFKGKTRIIPKYIKIKCDTEIRNQSP